MTDTERIKIKREALKAKRNDLIHFNCEHCGKDVYMRAVNVRKKVLLLCNPCQISYTKSLRTEEQKRITHEKTVQTCLERYGTVNGGNSEISKKKARESWARNWGSEEECFKQRSLKAQKTFEEKYNGSYSTPEIIEKKAKTLIAKHGSVENAYKLRSQKAKETNIRNHNRYHNFVDMDWRSKRKETMLQKFGVEYYMQSAELQKQISDKFVTIGAVSGTWFYDNKYFDSFWEISLYIVLQEHNIPFEYHPSLGLYYINNQGKKSQYRPDFLIGDTLVEVKGDNQFNKDGLPIDCRGKDWSSKFKFMESLGVVMITKGEKEINTTMKVLSIKPYIAEALELKGNPNKYSFIESCKAPKRKERSKVKLLYEKEVELTQKDTIAKSE